MRFSVVGRGKIKKMIKVLYNFLRTSERGFIEPPRDPAIYENVHILTVFLFFFSFVIVVMLKFLGGNIYTFKKKLKRRSRKQEQEIVLL